MKRNRRSGPFKGKHKKIHLMADLGGNDVEQKDAQRTERRRHEANSRVQKYRN
jgi:hypothetical protein